MEWQGGNKQRTNYWQWRLSFILGDSNWKFFKVGYLWICIWAQTECSAGCDLWSIFSKCFEQSTSWCFGSHFFVARSHRFIAICHCPFLASFVFVFNEKRGKKTFHCNQLQHTRSACFKTDLPDYFRFNFVQVVTEPCWSVVLSWRHGGHMTETQDFQLQTTQLLEASCLFSFKSILLRTSGKCQSIKRTACMLNFIYIVQSKWYLRLKISVQGPFKQHVYLLLPSSPPLPRGPSLSFVTGRTGSCSALTPRQKLTGN